MHICWSFRPQVILTFPLFKFTIFNDPEVLYQLWNGVPIGPQKSKPSGRVLLGSSPYWCSWKWEGRQTCQGSSSSICSLPTTFQTPISPHLSGNSSRVAMQVGSSYYYHKYGRNKSNSSPALELCRHQELQWPNSPDPSLDRSHLSDPQISHVQKSWTILWILPVYCKTCWSSSPVLWIYEKGIYQGARGRMVPSTFLGSWDVWIWGSSFGGKLVFSLGYD